MRRSFFGLSGEWTRTVPDLEGDETPRHKVSLDVNAGILLELMVAEGRARLKDLEVAL